MKALRICQYISEIGQPHILESLVVASAEPLPVANGVDDTSFIHRLGAIHQYLNKHDAKSHVAIAQSRWLKLCFYKTYANAVDEITPVLQKCRQERHRKAKHIQTATYRRGLTHLPPTPESDRASMAQVNNSGKAATAALDYIVTCIQRKCGGTEERIRDRVRNYKKVGQILHRIFQAGLDPGILLFFPGATLHQPALKAHHCANDEASQKELMNPFKCKE